MGWSKEDREYDKMQKGFYVTGIERRIKKLEAENARLRESLNFIVNNASSWGLEAEEYVQRARDALEGKE